MGKRGARYGMALLLLAAAAWARQADLLARLDTEPPGWDGIRIGMSLVQIERRLGVTVALSPASGQPVCSRFATQGDYQGYRLVFGFAAAKPGAKLESLWVQFDGAETGASAAELVAALRARVPKAAYLPDPARPAASEADDSRPTYLLPGEPAVALRFAPRNGVLIGLRSCLLPT